MLDKTIQVSNPKNVRRSKTASILYWIMFYSSAFIIGTKYFVYEDALISPMFSLAASVQHFALIATIIITFALVKRPSLHFVKKIACAVAMLILLVGCCYQPARTHVALQALLGVTLGMGAASSLLTFIYELNNTERFYSLVISNVLVAALAVFPMFFTRDTLAFEIFALILCVACLVLTFLEDKPSVSLGEPRQPIKKKFYYALALAATGGLFSVGGAMFLIGHVSADNRSVLFAFYAACAIAALLFMSIYKRLKQPVTACLNVGFGCSALSVMFYFLSDYSTVLSYFAAAMAGVTFTLCMMTLYYVSCLIIKKYQSKVFFKAVTISVNVVGGLVGLFSTYMSVYAPTTVVDAVLSVCGCVGVLILCSAIYWGKSFSDSEWQEDYVVFDTALPKEEVFGLYGISAKEQEILADMLENKTIKQIADEHFITVNTVKSHRASIYRKLNISTRQELMERFKDKE